MSSDDSRSSVTSLKVASDVDATEVADALRDAASGVSNGALRRFGAEDDLWNILAVDTPDALLRTLAADVEAGRAYVTSLTYTERLAADTPVEERLDLFVAYDNRAGEYHCEATYVPPSASTEIATTDDWDVDTTE